MSALSKHQPVIRALLRTPVNNLDELAEDQDAVVRNARNQAFRRSDPAVRALRKQVPRNRRLYYAGQVPFSAILERITRHLVRL